MILAGLGVGPSMPLFTLAVQNAVDVRFIGQATSASQFFRQTGATVGAAIMGAVLAATLGMAFSGLELPERVSMAPGMSTEELVSTGGADLPTRIRQAFEEAASEAETEAGAEELRRQGEAAAEETTIVVRAAFTEATTRIYWLAFGLIFVAILLSARIPELPLRTTHDRAEVAEQPESTGVVAP